jgi:hypothetical protein
VPAIAEWLPAKYLVKVEAPKTIASREQHEASEASRIATQGTSNRGRDRNG